MRKSWPIVCVVLLMAVFTVAAVACDDDDDDDGDTNGTPVTMTELTATISEMDGSGVSALWPGYPRQRRAWRWLGTAGSTTASTPTPRLREGAACQPSEILGS